MKNERLAIEQHQKAVLQATIDSAKMGVYLKCLKAFRGCLTLNEALDRVEAAMLEDLPLLKEEHSA